MSFVLHVLMVALYTISLLMHLFCCGHVSLFLQLQLAVVVTCGWLFLIIRVLCFEIMFLTIHATVANLNSVSVENFVQFVASGKVCVHEVEKIACDVCLNVFARGGLNQMKERCLFLREYST